MLRWIALVLCACGVTVCSSAAVGAPKHAATPRPRVSGAAPKPPGDMRRRNSIVMDLDFEESAGAGGGDAIDITGTIQLILDRIAARTAPENDFGQPRPLVWVGVTGEKECHDSTDAGILEVRVARFVGRDRTFVLIGHQEEEADLAFTLYSCAGQELLHYPLDPSSPYGTGRFAPYYLSVTGTISVVALGNAHSDNSSIAAVIGVVNSYSTLQANIGAHDPNRLRLLALYRLMGNIPGENVPAPAPGTVSSLLQSCSFGVDPDGVIRLHCVGGTPP